MSTPASPPARRFLALWFPWFATERLAAEGGAFAPHVPVATIAPVKGALRLAALDPTAQALGLTPAMPLADARAQVPDLIAIDADPAADARWLERLADGCVRWTPWVAIDAPDGLVLDISGCAHLAGGEDALAAEIAARLAGAGMRARCRIAANADAARALARHGGETIAEVGQLPVAALELDGEVLTALTRAGLKTVGAVAARSAAAIAARFGDAAVAALARLDGRLHRPIDPRRTLPIVTVERRFAEPVARTEYVLEVLGELVGEAAVELRRREQGGRRFEAMLFRSDGLPRTLAVETGRPTRDVGEVRRLIDERIDALSDPIDPGFGFDLVRLAVTRAEPLKPAQLRLEGGAVADDQVAGLVDRLSTRLGRDALERLAPVDTHIPEQAQLALPAVATAAPARWPLQEAGEPPLRPLHLFDPPQPIAIEDEDGDWDADLPPLRFRWRRRLHEVRRYEGPERIAAEWWTRDDNAGLTRDYYRVEDARGRRLWLFRHGLAGRERLMPKWFVHGVFA